MKMVNVRCSHVKRDQCFFLDKSKRQETAPALHHIQLDFFVPILHLLVDGGSLELDTHTHSPYV